MKLSDRVADVLAKGRKLAPVALRDVAGLFGLGLMVRGVALVSEPGAYIFAGAALLLVSWVSAGKKAG